MTNRIAVILSLHGAFLVLACLGVFGCTQSGSAGAPTGSDINSRRSPLAVVAPAAAAAERAPNFDPGSVIDPRPTAIRITPNMLREEVEADRKRAAEAADPATWISRARSQTTVAVEAIPVGVERAGMNGERHRDFRVLSVLHGRIEATFILVQSEANVTGCSLGLRAQPNTRYVMLLQPSPGGHFTLIDDATAWLVEEAPGSPTFARGSLIASAAQLQTLFAAVR